MPSQVPLIALLITGHVPGDDAESFTNIHHVACEEVTWYWPLFEGVVASFQQVPVQAQASTLHSLTAFLSDPKSWFIAVLWQTDGFSMLLCMDHLGEIGC